MKVAKPIYRNPNLGFCGSKAFSGTREKALSLDKEHRPYIRGSRMYPHLPNDWDTKFIPRQRSWKTRVKKRHQWVKHIMTPGEWRWVRGIGDWWDC